MDRKKWFKIALFAGAACLVVYLVQSGILAQLTFANLKARQGELQEWTRLHHTKAVIYYFVVYVVSVAVSLPGAGVLTLAGGALFGLIEGTILVSFASTLGATLCMMGTRFVFRDWVIANFRTGYEKVQKGLDKDGPYYLFSLRLIPVVPFFVINLVFGLTKMKAFTFFWVSQIGMLPGTIAYVNAGTELSKIESLSGLLSLPVILSFVLLGIFPWIARLILDSVQRRRVYAGFLRPAIFEYDILVIGAGAAGLVSAYIAAALKSKVGLIEKNKMGGDCLYTGCVPSKALIRSAHVAHLFRRGAEFGLQAAAPQVDFAKVFERIQKIITKIEPNDSVERYSGLGVDCIQGSAMIEDPFRVKVGDRVITTRNIIVATGASPIIPEIPGLKDVPYHTSETLWKIREAPKSVLIVGGGPIGCEMAQAFQRLGSQVTLVERRERLLEREDQEVSDLIAGTFKAEGMDVQLKSEVSRFEKSGNGGKALLKNGQAVSFDIAIMALGRRAHVKGFGLEKLGINIRDNGTLETDEFLRTKFHNILACGDVTGPFQFTHAASHQAGFAVLNALFAPLKTFKADYSALPWCTYTDPEVARLGLNEMEAKAGGIEFEVTTYALDHLDRAICEGENRGFVKVLTGKGKGNILGVTIAGAHAGDIMAEFTLAKRKKMTLNDILNTVHSYPTFAEANRFVSGAWKRNHAPQGALRFLKKFHAWRRGTA